MIPIKYAPFINENGLTIRELKLIIKNLPECDNAGDPYTVWVETNGGSCKPVTGAWEFNPSINGSDVLLLTNEDNK